MIVAANIHEIYYYYYHYHYYHYYHYYLKKANQNIAQSADNYTEFSIVINNPRSEFVRVTTNKNNVSNLEEILKIMRTLASGVDGECKHYFYIIRLSNIFKFILTSIYYYSTQEESDEESDEEEVSDRKQKTNKSHQSTKVLSRDINLKRYNIEPYILSATKHIRSRWIWENGRAPGAGLGFDVARITLKLFTDSDPYKPITLYAFNPGICTVLAETMAFYNNKKPDNAPPLIIRGFNMY